MLGLAATQQPSTLYPVEPGVHELVTRAGRMQVAVNVPATESDLAVADAALLERLQAPQLPVAAPPPARGAATGTSASVALAPWLLGLLALLVVAEPLFANLGLRRAGLPGA
jgi:hypothetical protein